MVFKPKVFGLENLIALCVVVSREGVVKVRNTFSLDNGCVKDAVVFCRVIPDGKALPDNLNPLKA